MRRYETPDIRWVDTDAHQVGKRSGVAMIIKARVDKKPIAVTRVERDRLTKARAEQRELDLFRIGWR